MAIHKGYKLRDGFRWLTLYQGDDQGVRHNYNQIATLENKDKKRKEDKITSATVKYWINQAIKVVEDSGILKGVK